MHPEFLGIVVAQSTAARHLPGPRKPPSQTWQSFLTSHLVRTASIIGQVEVLLSLHKFDEKRHHADGKHQQERFAIDAERSDDSPVVEGPSDARGQSKRQAMARAIGLRRS